MKKAPAIIAAVSIYTAFEVVFLISFVTPNNRQISPTAYQAFVGWSQFVLIPGMAILFSRLMYGPRGWRKRAITILAAGSLGVVLLLFGVIGAAFVIGWTASLHPWLGAVSAAATIGGIVLGVNWIVRKTTNRTIRMESERWLEERHQHTPIDRKRKERAIRWALWIPSAMVLVVGLSFIQVWGLLSHAAQPRVGHLSRYRIEVPLTWVVLSSDWKPTNGYVWAAGLAGRGSALFGLFETRSDLRLAYWSLRFQLDGNQIESQNGRRFPPQEEITGQRQLDVAGQEVSCVEYLPLYFRRLGTHNDASDTFVDCSSSIGFAGSFAGDAALLPDFYRMLESVKEIK